MSLVTFVGDEVTAAGYRLSGVDVLVADHSNGWRLITRACERASLVLVGSELTQGLDSQQLDQLLLSTRPPVLVVPDLREQAESSDISRRIHKQLGMLE